MDAHVFVETAELCERFEWDDLGEVVCTTRRAPDKATSNEDSALVARLDGGRLVLAVADGLGGHAAGEQASRIAVESLKAALGGWTVEAPLREAVLVGMDAANAAVRDLGTGSRTTLALVAVEEGRVRAFHVGDSHVLCFGGGGAIRLETIPHSPVGFALEAGLLCEEEALDHEDRHLVSNVVGEPGMHIGLSSPLELRPRDSVVIASDGLFDNLDSARVIELLRRGPLLEAVEELVAACTAQMLAGGHPDDLTVVVYRPAGAR